VRSLNTAAAGVLDAGVDAVERSQVGIADMKRGGVARVDGMRLIAQVAATARDRVAAVDLGSSHGLVGPLADARARFARRIPKLTKALGDLHVVATGLTSFLDGPRTYILFAANNDEMRLGSGAFLSGSVLTTKHGTLTLFPMQSTAPWLLKAKQAPALSADQQKVWGWLAPNEEWRNLAASPRFDTTAALARKMMMARHPDVPIDGVLAIDPVALEGVVAATRPVTLGAHQYSGDALLKYVFIDQYETDTFANQQRARRDALGVIAQQAIGALDAGTWDTRTLVHQLRLVGKGRHVLAWSIHPDEQRAWAIAGVDGTLPDSSVTVGLHNRGGNKLDSFLGVHGEVRSTPRADGIHVDVDMKMHNTTPTGLSAYIAGPYPGAVNGKNGTYQGILAFYVPAAATQMQVVSFDPAVTTGRDGTHHVVAVQVHIDRGKSDEVRLSFVLPRGTPEIVVEPSARYPAITWTAGTTTWTDNAPQTVSLGATPLR
jgi:hypothetical protein